VTGGHRRVCTKLLQAWPRFDLEQLHVVHVAQQICLDQDSAQRNLRRANGCRSGIIDLIQIDPHDAMLNNATIRSEQQDFPPVPASASCRIGRLRFACHNPQAHRRSVKPFHRHCHVAPVIEQAAVWLRHNNRLHRLQTTNVVGQRIKKPDQTRRSRNRIVRIVIVLEGGHAVRIAG